MNLSRYIKGALAGAGIFAASNNISNAANLSIKADYSPFILTERAVKDVSPTMTVESKDKLETDEVSLTGRLTGDEFDCSGGCIKTITLEDNLIMQKSSSKGGSEETSGAIKADYSRLRNTLKAMLKTDWFSFGLTHLTEKEKITSPKTKLSTRQSLQAFGPVVRVPFQHQGNINTRFNTDFSIFLGGDGAYKDSGLERNRNLSSILSETSVELGKPLGNDFLREIGIRADIDYFSKNIKQTSPMPVYEDYKDTRLRYGAELFAKVKKYLTLKLGVKKEQHASKGTFETKDNQMRIYGGAQADVFF